MGVAIVPTSLKHGFNLEVQFLEIPNIPQKAELYVIWKEDNRNPALHQMMQFL